MRGVHILLLFQGIRARHKEREIGSNEAGEEFCDTINKGMPPNEGRQERDLQNFAYQALQLFAGEMTF